MCRILITQPASISGLKVDLYENKVNSKNANKWANLCWRFGALCVLWSTQRISGGSAITTSTLASQVHLSHLCTKNIPSVEEVLTVQCLLSWVFIMQWMLLQNYQKVLLTLTTSTQQVLQRQQLKRFLSLCFYTHQKIPSDSSVQIFVPSSQCSSCTASCNNAWVVFMHSLQQ